MPNLRSPRPEACPLLVIVDMNGVLLVRKSKRSASLRPHLDHFLHVLHELSGRVKVAVWSSMVQANLYPLVEQAFGDYAASLEFVWDQEWCTQGWVKGMKKPLFRKDLENLRWTEWREHWPEHVLLIDDDPIKCTENPSGTAIHPKSFTGLEEDDRELLWIASYIKALAASECTSARDFVLSTPYDTFEEVSDTEQPIVHRRKKIKASDDEDTIEAYWPDEDAWLPAKLIKVLQNGDNVVTWDEDGSTSTVPSDYVRHVL